MDYQNATKAQIDALDPTQLVDELETANEALRQAMTAGNKEEIEQRLRAVWMVGIGLRRRFPSRSW